MTGGIWRAKRWYVLLCHGEEFRRNDEAIQLDRHGALRAPRDDTAKRTATQDLSLLFRSFSFSYSYSFSSDFISSVSEKFENE